MEKEKLFIANIKLTKNFVIVEFDATLDKKAKKLSAVQSVFFTHAQAKTLGLSDEAIGYEFESKRV